MAVPDITINYLVVLISAVISFIIGGLWYSPILFGNAWMKSGGFNQKDIEAAKKKGMGKLYLTGFIGTLLMAFVLAHFVQYLSAGTFIEGMQAGFWIWIGFIVPILIGSVLWESKPIKFYLINVLYHLVSLLIMAGILASWQ